MGIGDNVKAAEIHALASDSSHVFQVTSTGHMLQAGYGLKIALALCSGTQDNMSWPFADKSMVSN